MKKSLFLTTCLIVVTSHLFAQYNFQLLGKKTYTGQNLSGSWGWNDTINNKEYALVGTTKGLSIVDITTPTTPVEVKFINGKQGTWRECQTYKNYAYITQDNDTTNSEGILIYDLSQLPGGKADTFKGSTPNDYITRNHSLFIDEKGFLYLNGGRININGGGQNGTIIYDLKPNPKRPTFVGYTPSPSGTSTNYVHDCYARNDTLFEAHIYNNRFTVWDIRNRSNPVKIQDFATAYNTIHNMWLSDNSKTLFVTHEEFNLPAEAYDISDLSNIRQLCEFKVSPTNQEILHNVHVLNDFVIGSYYSDGVAIFDASDPTNVIPVGYYDTQPTSTRTENGVWGAWGFYKSGVISLSDMKMGLYVVKPTYVRGARIQGIVTDTNTTQVLSNVKISFVDTAISANSDIDGLYKTGSAKAGLTNFKAEKAGYITKFFKATLINGTTLNVDIQLRQIPVYTTQNASFCEGSNFILPDGRRVSAPGIYISNLISPTGRDSIITVNLSKKNNSVRVISVSFCQGYTYTLPKGRVVSSAGLYTDTLINSIGCDSLININLTQKNRSVSSISASFCQGYTYTLPKGRVVSSAGTYIDTLINSIGCDSIVTTNLTQKNRSVSSVSASFCQGNTFTLPTGRVVSNAGTYTDTLVNSIGCDSIVTTNLTQKNRSLRSISASFCQGYSYTLPKGSIVNSAGTYIDTLINSIGCDSIVTTNLTQKNRSVRSISASFCQGYSYTLPKGSIVNSAGTYIDTLVNSIGCDSIITTNLIQKNRSVRSISASFCQGYSYTLPKGSIVNSAGTYIDTLVNSIGCDSIVTTILTQKNRSFRTVNASFCQGYSYTLPKGRIVNSTGTYIDTLINSVGCDSIVTTNLAQKSRTTSSFSTSFCQGTNYTLPSGKVVSAGAVYADTIPNAAGCDSVITITLSQLPRSSSIKVANICDGDSYLLPDGTSTSESGVFNDTLQNFRGCDSLLTTYVYVHPVYSISKQDSIYQGETYTLPGGNTTSIQGIYTDSLQTSFGCDSVITIDLKVLTTTGIRNLTNDIQLKFVLNNNELTIINRSSSIITELAIYNSIGTLVNIYYKPESTILLPALPKDIYIIRAITNNKEERVGKVVIY
ncbi:MAG: choice-of-anchor B family protein [Sphingobacteriales bacterium]|nr:choice-of-anchor B family protein [Sphingobacteriales bacterium]